MFGFGLWVGLMGGCEYANVMYMIRTNDKLLFTEKELACNMCTIGEDSGIICAALIALFLDNTFLKV